MAPRKPPESDIHLSSDPRISTVQAGLIFAKSQPFGNLVSLLILAAVCGGIWYGVPSWINQTKAMITEQREDFRQILEGIEKRHALERAQERADFRVEMREQRQTFKAALEDILSNKQTSVTRAFGDQ